MTCRQTKMLQFSEHIPPETGAYIVGGSVRDLLLDRKPVDYDIAVGENPEKYAQRIAAGTNGRIVVMGKSEQTIFRVVSKHHQLVFDVAPISGTTIEIDLMKRDFSVNALAVSVSSGRLIDVAGGQEDLLKKQVRMLSPDVFRKDPIRLLRAFRMGAGLQFEIEPATLAAIESNATMIKNTAGERIREELLLLLQSAESFHFIEQMADTGLLLALLPELASLKGCRQNRFHRFDVFEHTLNAYHHLESILNGADPFLSRFGDQHLTRFNNDTGPLLKWAVLLHDLGKPDTRTVDDNEAVHFYGHPQKSADTAAAICRRLRFSNKDRLFTVSVIRHHLRPLSLFTLQQSQNIGTKSMTRLFIACGDYTPFVLLHALADHKGKTDDEDHLPFVSFIADLIDAYALRYEPVRQNPPLITGRDLINDFGLSPSPLFKEILGSIEEARLSERIKTRREAYRMVEKILMT